MLYAVIYMYTSDVLIHVLGTTVGPNVFQWISANLMITGFSQATVLCVMAFYPYIIT